MTAGRIIVRGAAASAAGLIVRLGARLAFLVIAGQLYGVAAFGAYSLAVATIELAVSLGGLGMKRLIFQQLDGRGPRPEAHILADAVLVVGAASALLAAGLMAAAAWLPSHMIAPDIADATVLLAPLIVGQSLLDLLLAATRWKHLIRFEVAGRSLVEPYVAVAGAAAAWLAGFGATGLLIGYALGTLAALLFAGFGVAGAFDLAGLRGYRPRARRALAMVRGAAANTMADGLSALFVRLDLYLVGVLLGQHAAGVYGMARQLALPIRQVRQSFDGLLTPLASRTMQAEGTATAARAIASATRLILALQAPMVIGMIALGHPLLHWLGPEFAAGWLAATLLALAETVQGAFGLGELLLVYRRPRLGLAIVAGAVLLGLGAGVSLTLAWGLAGAAGAVLLTQSIRAAARRGALRWSLGVGVPLRSILAPVAAGLAGSAAAWTAGAGGLGVAAWGPALAAGLLVYLLVLFGWLCATGTRLGFDHFTSPA
ncbi:MAG: lipopolysaccharide biosynthesis protein [Allosphingosinicella sp.]